MKAERLKRLLGFLLFVLAAHALADGLKEETVTLDTGTGTLAGTLLVPASSGKMPVALIIAGSGPTDRDGNSALIKGHNDSLKMLAHALAKAGIASLRYDKRAIAASAAAATKKSELRFDTYIDDAAKWAGRLRADQRFGPLVIIGHSEGSLIGMAAAQRVNAAAFISLSGAGEPALPLMRKQFAGKLPPDLAAANEHIMSELEQGRPVSDVPPALMTVWRPSVQPYLMSWFKYNPTERIAALDMPVLIVQGDNDMQVSVDQAKALKAAKPNAQLEIIPGMNHVLKLVPSGDMQRNLASYGDPSLPLAPKLAETITGFLRQAHMSAK